MCNSQKGSKTLEEWDKSRRTYQYETDKDFEKNLKEWVALEKERIRLAGDPRQQEVLKWCRDGLERAKRRQGRRVSTGNTC